MKWGNEKKKYDWLNTYPKYELSPLAAASALTLGISGVKDEMSKNLDSIVACDNWESERFKRGSAVSLKSEQYSGLAIGYFGISAVLSAVYFPAMGFYSELVNLTKK
jgi:hypothetical protein